MTLGVGEALVGVTVGVTAVAVIWVGVASAGLMISLSPGKISELRLRPFWFSRVDNSIWYTLAIPMRVCPCWTICTIEPSGPGVAA